MKIKVKTTFWEDYDQGKSLTTTEIIGGALLAGIIIPIIFNKPLLGLWFATPTAITMLMMRLSYNAWSKKKHEEKEQKDLKEVTSGEARTDKEL